MKIKEEPLLGFNIKHILNKNEMNFVQKYPAFATALCILICTIVIPSFLLSLSFLIDLPNDWIAYTLLILSALSFIYCSDYYFFQEGASFTSNYKSLFFSRNLFKECQFFILNKNSSFEKLINPWQKYQKGLFDLNINFGAIIINQNKRARKWIKKQVTIHEKGELFYYYARFLVCGIGGEENIALALKFTNKAIKLNELRAYSLLGYIYSLEKSNFYNPEKSFNAFLLGTDVEDPISSISLAFCYLVGFGTSKDIEQAKILSLRALLEKKQMSGALILSLIYSHEDKGQAYFYEKVAAKLSGAENFQEEIEFCSILEKDLDIEQIKIIKTQAIELGSKIYFQKLKASGYKNAMKELGKINLAKAFMS